VNGRGRARRGHSAIGVVSIALASLAVGVAVRAPSSEADGDRPVSGVVLTWAFAADVTAGNPDGSCNFLSAGTAGDQRSSTPWSVTSPSPGFAAQDGAVTVERPDPSGAYRPVTWSNRCTGPDGTTALTPGTSAGTRIVLAAGAGTVDVGAGTAALRWAGSFTAAQAGGRSYLSIADPTLVVTADGSGTLSATRSGYGPDGDGSGSWGPRPAERVVLAVFAHVGVGPDGFDATATTSVNEPGAATITVDYSSAAAPLASDPSTIPTGPPTAAGPARPSRPSTPATPATPKAPVSPSHTVTPAPTERSLPRSESSASVRRAAAGPAARTPTAACDLAAGIRGGSLTWGFKDSFRAYVAGGLPANRITATGGAKILPQGLARPGVAASGTYLWPFVSSAGYTSPSRFSVQFGGSVTLAYPAHFFSLTIARPRLVVRGTGGTLYADVSVTSSQPGSPPARTTSHPSDPLATVDLRGSNAVTDASGITRVLRTQIADVDSFTFNGSTFYTKGQALDDATVLLSGCRGAAAPVGLGETVGAPSADPGHPSDSSGSAAAGNLIPKTRFRPGDVAATGADVRLPLLLAAALLGVGGVLSLAAGRRHSLPIRPTPIRPTPIRPTVHPARKGTDT
jgi:hypothetical protein